VADEAGLPRLRQAFADLGVQDVNLTAFYMGNWLTDISQVRDPNAGCPGVWASAAGRLLRDKIGGLVAPLVALIDELVGEQDVPAEFAATPQTAGSWIDQTKRILSEAVKEEVTEFVQEADLLFKSLAGLAPVLLNELLTLLVKFAAYAKFAHADPLLGKPGLDFRVFTQVFACHFTYYFPHEHLDRPHCDFTGDASCAASWGRHALTSRDRIFANQLASGESAIGSQSASTYAYLDECRRAAAALFTVIDRDWAAKYFTTGVDYQNDPGFHQGLADFGHALHAVEDFFAHSTFIEHAAMLKGAAYLRDQLYGPGRQQWIPSATRRMLELDQSDFAATKVFRRLKRFDPDIERQESAAGWAFLPDESNVVTGYFDCWDTMMSLLHMLEETLAFDASEAAIDPFSDYLKRYREDRGDEFLERIRNINATLNQQTVEGRLRSDLRTLLDFYTEERRLGAVDEEAAARDIHATIRKKRLFRGVPAAMLDVVVRLVYLLVDRALVKAQAGRISWNLYKLIETVSELFKDPIGFLAEPFNNKLTEGGWFELKFITSWIYRLYFEDKLDAVRFELKTKLHEMIGAYRVGSHSLLSKDYEDEPLFPQAFNCARALHWYIVETMCRWTDSAWLDQAGDRTTWVDWDELLSAFLRHPLTYEKEPVLTPESVSCPLWEVYQVQGEGETFRTIARNKLVGRAFNGAEYGSYEELLVANLGTRHVFRRDDIAGTRVDDSAIAERVIQTGMGVPDPSGHSYQLRPGLGVWIPMTLEFSVDRTKETVWYAEMMDLDRDAWESQMATYRQEKALRSRPPFEYHQIRYQTTDDRDERLRDGLELLSRLERLYIPDLDRRANTPPCARKRPA
jgi:hypothetical protein